MVTQYFQESLCEQFTSFTASHMYLSLSFKNPEPHASEFQEHWRVMFYMYK